MTTASVPGAYHTLHQHRAKLQQELLDTGRLINAAALIHQLPDEVLAEIFLFALSPSSFPWHDLSQSADQRFLVLLGVCARWRSVVCSTPRFWCDITTHKGHEWPNLTLSRCAGAPANASLRDETLSPEVFTSVLPRFTHILRSLHVTDITGSAMARLLALIDEANMPVLHSMSIHSHRLRELRLRAEAYTHLRLLTLTGFKIPLQHALYTRLHTLNLRNCQWMVSMSQFWDILETTSRLTHLSLQDCDLPLFPNGSDPSSAQLCRPPVSLPHLSVFKMTRQPPYAIRQLLALLRLPSRTDSTLEGNSGLPSDFKECDNLLVELLPTDPWSLMPGISSVTSVALRADRWHPSPSYGLCTSGNEGQMSLSLAAADGETNWSEVLRPLFLDVCTLFSHAPVTKLVVFGEMAFVSSLAWAGLFRHFPLLEEFSLSGYGSPASMWQGLQLASEDASAAGGSLCCPGLAHVEMISEDSIRFTSPRLVECMLRALRLREQQGLRLKSLLLRLHYPNREAYEKYFSDYGEELRRLVRYVDYSRKNASPEPDALEGSDYMEDS